MHLTKNRRQSAKIRPFKLVPVRQGVFAEQGHQWAQPSQRHLRELLRRVAVTHRAEALEKAGRARRLMVGKYSPAALAEELRGHLERIQGVVAGRGGEL